MKILNFVSSPFELYYLSSIACLLLEKDKNLEIKLLISKRVEDKITPEIQSLYSEIKVVELPALTKNHYQTIKFRKYLKNFDFDFDIICFGSSREFFSNMLCRHIPKNIRLIAFRMATQKIEELENLKKRPILSFLLNIKNFFFGYSLMEYKFRTDARARVEKNLIKYPYYRTITITDYDIKKEEDNWRLPPPFVALRKIYKPISENNPPTILVAGERTPLFSGWDKEAQEKYERFLDYLRENFKNYKLYFKPRKTLTDPSKFNLKGFQILSEDISLEELCLKENISKIISIKSTSSKVGAYFGISAYLLHPLFKLPEDLRLIVEAYFDDMHSIIRVSKLEDLKKDSKDITENYDFEELVSFYWKAIIE